MTKRGQQMMSEPLRRQDGRPRRVRPEKHNIWNAFHPIGGSLKADVVDDADHLWLASRGIEPEALSVLRAVRGVVLPLVDRLQSPSRDGRLLKSFSFVVHDRSSGVPCPAEDHAAYIHMRLQFRPGVDARKVLPKNQWAYVRQIPWKEEEALTHLVLDAQAAWYLVLIAKEAGKPDLEVLREVRKYLHFFANMSQMRIQ